MPCLCGCKHDFHCRFKLKGSVGSVTADRCVAMPRSSSSAANATRSHIPVSDGPYPTYHPTAMHVKLIFGCWRTERLRNTTTHC